MATRETRRDRGDRIFRHVKDRLLSELRITRTGSNLSLRTVARELGWSHARYGRFESGSVAITLRELAQAGAILGLDLTAGFRPRGDPLRDAGQQGLAERFRRLLAPGWKVAAEVLLPNPGDRRSWDLFLRLQTQRLGVELETRVRDVQALVRKMRERERDGGADRILIVLSDSGHNRRVLPELVEALGPTFATSPRLIFRALREGRPIPGSGVILL